MKPFPPLLVFAIVMAVSLGIPFGFYALLTRGRRRIMAEIRVGAAERGWEFHLLRWQGDPTAFRLDGQGTSGSWTVKSSSTSGNDRGWSVRMEMSFPHLAGKSDFALFPRDPEGGGGRHPLSRVPLGFEARFASLSRLTANEADFLRIAQEISSGCPAFDGSYQVLVIPGRELQGVVDRKLAERLLQWPEGTVKPHSLLAWRDPFGVHFQARLAYQPNWAAVTYLISAGEEICSRLPPPVPVACPQPEGAVDRLIRWLLG